LAVIANVSFPAYAPRHGILKAAISIEAAIVLTVLDATIISQKWWGALTCPVAVAYALRMSCKGDPIVTVVLYSTRHLADACNVLIFVGMDVSVVTAVTTVLDVVFVVMTDGARTGNVGAVDAVVAGVTFAESIGTQPMIGAVLGTIENAKGPQIIKDEGFVCCVDTRSIWLLCITHAAVSAQSVMRLTNEDGCMF